MKIGLLGFGTVGQGVYEILQSQEMKQKNIQIQSILVREIQKYQDRYGKQLPFVTDPDKILLDDDIDVIVEVLGGIEEPFTYIRTALEKKKSVVTANKAVLAAHMKELITLAEQQGVSLLYEASVGGGIPLIRTLAESSKVVRYHEVAGILNGTSNFILTRMAQQGLDFDEALKLAQEAGFAEADPTDDIDGPDVARKISVLATTIFGKHLPVESISMTGIRHITKADMAWAEDKGGVIKLVGRAKWTGEGYQAEVSPEFIPVDSMMATVNDEYNIAIAQGNFLQQICLCGEGAGKYSTASAVVGDLVKIYESAGQRTYYKDKIDFTPVSVEVIPSNYYNNAKEKTNSFKVKILEEIAPKRVR